MDNYIIISFIGEGSFGRVFKAKNKETHETIALKVIRKVTLKFLLSLPKKRYQPLVSVLHSYKTNLT